MKITNMEGESDKQEQKVRNDLKEKYDEYYNGQSEWRKIGAECKVSRITEMCANVQHKYVIDVGAGEGSITQLLSNKGFADEIVCAEISESGVKTIKNRNIRNVDDVVHFDGYNLPYSDDEFDLAIATHVLEHVEYQRKFLEELARVSKYVYVEVPLLHTLRMSPNFNGNSVGHINFYNYKTFRRLLQTSKYNIIEQKIFDHTLNSLTYNYNYIFGFIKYLIYKSGRNLNSELTSKLLVYHCGAICNV
jgi:ubiquinone/menaquinone biosynthesis C-methylase UbiE